MRKMVFCVTGVALPLLLAACSQEDESSREIVMSNKTDPSPIYQTEEMGPTGSSDPESASDNQAGTVVYKSSDPSNLELNAVTEAVNAGALELKPLDFNNMEP